MSKNVRHTFPCFAAMAMFVGLVGFASARARAQTTVSVEGDLNHNSHGQYAELARVPEKARVKANPLEHDPDAIAAGAKLYQQHCAECHGEKAAGTKRGPSLRKETVEEATPGTLFWILSNGIIRHGMPDWSKLPEPERWQLVTFIKSLRAPAKPETSPTPRSEAEGATALFLRRR